MHPLNCEMLLPSVRHVLVVHIRLKTVFKVLAVLCLVEQLPYCDLFETQSMTSRLTSMVGLRGHFITLPRVGGFIIFVLYFSLWKKVLPPALLSSPYCRLSSAKGLGTSGDVLGGVAGFLFFYHYYGVNRAHMGI